MTTWGNNSKHNIDSLQLCRADIVNMIAKGCLLMNQANTEQHYHSIGLLFFCAYD